MQGFDSSALGNISCPLVIIFPVCWKAQQSRKDPLGHVFTWATHTPLHVYLLLYLIRVTHHTIVHISSCDHRSCDHQGGHGGARLAGPAGSCSKSTGVSSWPFRVL